MAKVWGKKCKECKEDQLWHAETCSQRRRKRPPKAAKPKKAAGAKRSRWSLR